MKTGAKTFELLDSFVDQIGEANVVQLITNSGSNYVLVGKSLEAKGQICIGFHVLHIVLTLCWSILRKFPELQELWKKPFK